MRLNQLDGKNRYMNGLRTAMQKGIAAAQDKSFTEADNPYRNYEHRQCWLDCFRTERKKGLVTQDGTFIPAPAKPDLANNGNTLPGSSDVDAINGS